MSRLFHYYGDTVRQCFFLAGIIMLVTLPFFRDEIPAPTTLGIFSILVVVVAAGLTSPTQKWVMILDVCASLLGFIAFEYYAIIRYSPSGDTLFWIDQLLAALFFLALYYSTKTIRGQFGE